jgi:hypothetical protein
MSLIHLAAGIVLLFMGRKVYWLLVALIGFVAGSLAAGWMFPTQSIALALIVGLLLGGLGALLAVLFNKASLVLAGFLAGGYLVHVIQQLLGWQPAQLAWLPILVGAILCGVLALVVFDWGLTILSAMIGASIIASAFPLIAPARLALWVVLFATGCLVQIHLSRS